MLNIVMIVKNEHYCLPIALASLAQDDVIQIWITDTGSIDDTVAVALATCPGAIIDHYRWDDNFSHARNYAKRNVPFGEWILSLDADETIDMESIHAIKNFIKEHKEHSWATGASIKHQAKNGSNTFYNIRLFKSAPEIYWQGACHEYIVGSLYNIKINDAIIEYGSSPTHILDPDRNIRILSTIYKTYKATSREIYYLGSSYYDAEDYGNAKRYLEEYLMLNESYKAERADAFYLLARADWELDLWDSARESCLKAILINPYFRAAINFLKSTIWPENYEPWDKMLEVADNRNVLFTRD